MKPNSSRKFAACLLVLGAAVSLSPWVTSAVALLLGAALAVAVGNPYQAKTKLYSTKLLAWSIVFLGAGMNLVSVSQAGVTGLAYTAGSIALTLSVGLVLGKLFKSDRDTSILISVGTAICGGSAIAAIAPVIRAKPHSMTVALGIVFLLNGIALMIFPPIGHFFHLSQQQFGFWSALAIHDTSSVVGAGLQYGAEALRLGTTIKLARALWIVPLTFAFSFYQRRSGDTGQVKTKKPWFILGFLLTSAIFTALPQLDVLGSAVAMIAKKGLTLTLFLIGANITRETLKSVGLKPFLQGFTLWILVSAASLLIFSHIN